MLSRTRARRLSAFPLAWERLLWSGRPVWLPRIGRFEEYHLTDFRALVRRGDRMLAELAIHDLERVELRESRWQRLCGTSTIVLHPKESLKKMASTPEDRTGSGLQAPGIGSSQTRRALSRLALKAEARSPMPTADAVVFANIRQGPPLALILELLATDPGGLEVDKSLVEEALGPGSSRLFGPRPQALAAWAATVVLLVVLSGVIVARHEIPTPITYPADDAIYPGGHKRSRAEIVAFMEHEVMPFARRALGPIKDGPGKVTCFTCHGADAEARGWQMPAVRVLPEPDLRRGGMEHFASLIDAQMRNAVYGYLAEGQKQDRAAYMRGVVMPGMARLLHRPPYDFTQSYRYNRGRFAFGCYHCHLVSAPEQSGSLDSP